MITEGNATAQNFDTEAPKILDGIQRAADRGIGLIQVREKGLTAGKLRILAEKAVQICGESASRVLINERIDIALATGAAGVQLTSQSMPVERVRQVCPASFLIGVSTHSSKEVIAARDRGADFALFGPVFDTPSKRKYGEPKGVKALAHAVAASPGFPVVAVGGVNASNAGLIMESGAAGFAAIRMFWEAAGL